jgi:hypothetical protein
MKLFEFTEQAIPIAPPGRKLPMQKSKMMKRRMERSRSCPIVPALIASKLLVSSTPNAKVRFPAWRHLILNHPRA